ncbi:hypothetical protein AB0D73_34830, partial [Streptomyces sp. NPDC048215]|uniref:hypothetical protein n=1 Tax=Streptomyces sp. NPDC048215 TaxID=3156690 RepID=UPI0033EFE751
RPGMGLELRAHYPVFAETFDAIDAHLGLDLVAPTGHSPTPGAILRKVSRLTVMPSDNHDSIN